MAIDQRVCFLCHFGSGKKVAATQDCASCHAVPAAQHEAVMGDSSSCIKCHRTAEAEIKVQLGKCAQCHEDRSNYADMAHDKHVSSQHARCMDCHELMKHKHGELSAHYDEDCQKCHSTQESMFQGRTAFMAKAMPSTMAEMVDCSSCHIPVADEGVSSLSGIKESCAICHEEGYEEMADNWQEMIRDDGIEPAEKLLSSVQKLLKESADKPQYAKASSIYEEARARLLFVKKDGSLGVHNVDLADTLLTDAIDKLKECQGMLK